MAQVNRSPSADSSPEGSTYGNMNPWNLRRRHSCRTTSSLMLSRSPPPAHTGLFQFKSAAGPLAAQCTSNAADCRQCTAIGAAGARRTGGRSVPGGHLTGRDMVTRPPPPAPEGGLPPQMSPRRLCGDHRMSTRFPELPQSLLGRRT